MDDKGIKSFPLIKNKKKSDTYFQVWAKNISHPYHKPYFSKNNRIESSRDVSKLERLSFLPSSNYSIKFEKTSISVLEENCGVVSRESKTAEIFDAYIKLFAQQKCDHLKNNVKIISPFAAKLIRDFQWFILKHISMINIIGSNKSVEDFLNDVGIKNIVNVSPIEIPIKCIETEKKTATIGRRFLLKRYHSAEDQRKFDSWTKPYCYSEENSILNDLTALIDVDLRFNTERRHHTSRLTQLIRSLLKL